VGIYSATNGQNWISKNNWLNGGDPCSWDKVACAGSTVTRLYVVISNFRFWDSAKDLPLFSVCSKVFSFFFKRNLFSNGLSGTITPKIGNLTALQYLYEIFL
jgi:hypothetical protein